MRQIFSFDIIKNVVTIVKSRKKRVALLESSLFAFIAIAKICQNPLLSKLCLFCNKLNEHSTFVHFLENSRQELRNFFVILVYFLKQFSPKLKNEKFCFNPTSLTPVLIFFCLFGTLYLYEAQHNTCMPCTCITSENNARSDYHLCR